MPIKACVFDAYGTLFDVAAAARIAAQRQSMRNWRQSGRNWRKFGVQSSFNILGCGRSQEIIRIFGKSPKMDWILPWPP